MRALRLTYEEAGVLRWAFWAKTGYEPWSPVADVAAAELLDVPNSVEVYDLAASYAESAGLRDLAGKLHLLKEWDARVKALAASPPEWLRRAVIEVASSRREAFVHSIPEGHLRDVLPAGAVLVLNHRDDIERFANYDLPAALSWLLYPSIAGELPPERSEELRSGLRAIELAEGALRRAGAQVTLRTPTKVAGVWPSERLGLPMEGWRVGLQLSLVGWNLVGVNYWAAEPDGLMRFHYRINEVGVDGVSEGFVQAAVDGIKRALQDAYSMMRVADKVVRAALRHGYGPAPLASCEVHGPQVVCYHVTDEATLSVGRRAGRDRRVINILAGATEDAVTLTGVELSLPLSEEDYRRLMKAANNRSAAESLLAGRIEPTVGEPPPYLMRGVGVDLSLRGVLNLIIPPSGPLHGGLAPTATVPLATIDDVIGSIDAYLDRVAEAARRSVRELISMGEHEQESVPG